MIDNVPDIFVVKVIKYGQFLAKLGAVKKCHLI